MRIKQRFSFFWRPQKFSILTPLYNTPIEYLTTLLESMKNQTYKYWELCLADGSDDEHYKVGAICRRYVAEDSRFKYVKLEENRGISANTNACFTLATGSYIGLLDHDDVLHESALYEMMAAIKKTGADFLYTDEVKFIGDIMNIAGITGFNLKPGFGKDELRAHNYICHFTVFSRELLEREGRFWRSEMDGSQDHDLVLRLTEIARRIVHIPKVLYYWRVHEQSVSYNIENKIYAVKAAIRGIGEQLEREREQGVITTIPPFQTLYRINYQVEENPIISVIDYDTVVYEEDIVVLNQRAIGATGKYLMFLQSDVQMEGANWLTELLMYAQRRDVACVGGKILYPDQRFCFAGIALDRESEAKVRRICLGFPRDDHGYEAMLMHVRNTTAAWLGCMMIEKEKFLSLGGFQTRYGALADVDLSMRAMEKGFWNVWSPFACGEYHGSEEKVDYKKGNVFMFTKRWQKQLKEGDRFCHSVWIKKGLV